MDKLTRMQKQIDRLSKYVMESKEFENKIFVAVLIIYFYFAFQVAYWIGRTFLA